MRQPTQSFTDYEQLVHDEANHLVDDSSPRSSQEGLPTYAEATTDSTAANNKHRSDEKHRSDDKQHEPSDKKPSKVSPVRSIFTKSPHPSKSDSEARSKDSRPKSTREKAIILPPKDYYSSAKYIWVSVAGDQGTGMSEGGLRYA